MRGNTGLAEIREGF
jgi:hypothetical protein